MDSWDTHRTHTQLSLSIVTLANLILSGTGDGMRALLLAAQQHEQKYANYSALG